MRRQLYPCTACPLSQKVPGWLWWPKDGFNTWCQISLTTEMMVALESHLLGTAAGRAAQGLRRQNWPGLDPCISWTPYTSQKGPSDCHSCILAGTSPGKLASATKKCLHQHSSSSCSVITKCFLRRAADTMTLASFSVLISFSIASVGAAQYQEISNNFL